MAVNVPRGPKPEDDDELRAIVAVLQKYLDRHPGSVVETYRHGRYLVRIRIINPGFKGTTKSERHRSVWSYLEELPEEVLSDVSTLILVTPDELAKSFASMEFDDPIPAVL